MENGNGKYYAKSESSDGNGWVENKVHLRQAADLAEKFGDEIGRKEEARLCGLLHDFGKYGELFQDVLLRQKSGVDHAIGGAAVLYEISGKRSAYGAAIEAIYGHHDGLVALGYINDELKDSLRQCERKKRSSGKKASLAGEDEYRRAYSAFKSDFPEFVLPKLSRKKAAEEGTESSESKAHKNAELMLHTRMLFSCLVDADYSVSAGITDYSPNRIDPDALLERLEAYRREVRKNSASDSELNRLRDQVYEECGAAGELNPPGVFTLTAPTGVGKTLSMLHFALRHCKRHNKRRIILVLPYLTLTEQSEREYRNITRDILADHSQSRSDEATRENSGHSNPDGKKGELSDESDKEEVNRELSARWDAPFIITTSVRFFESLFAGRPADCRKLHSIANSVILFDEAQSLPPQLTPVTLRAVRALCDSYGCSMAFSTATQPDYNSIRQFGWKSTEIIENPSELYKAPALRRTKVEWRVLKGETPFSEIAEEMAGKNSVCAVVNLRRHARELYDHLKSSCRDDSVFYLTTDLCPAHRSEMIANIRTRLKEGLPCRVAATQCIEAGVDLDFDAMYRALAPLEAIIQAAGRCNRNGRLSGGPGIVTVFEPCDKKNPYPNAWYGNAAGITVKGMLGESGIDIHNPELVKAYYGELYKNLQECPKLLSALKNQDYKETDEAYDLISERDARQVIVPYAGKKELYERISEQALRGGLTAALIRQAAPITVSALDKDGIRDHCEELFFKRRGKEIPGGYYLILKGEAHKECYTEDKGLRFVKMTENNYIV